MPASTAESNILVRKGETTFQATSSTGEHGPVAYGEALFVDHETDSGEGVDEHIILCDGQGEDIEVYQMDPIEFDEDETVYTDECLVALVAAGEQLDGRDAGSDLEDPDEGEDDGEGGDDDGEDDGTDDGTDDTDADDTEDPDEDYGG